MNVSENVLLFLRAGGEILTSKSLLRWLLTMLL